MCICASPRVPYLKRCWPIDERLVQAPPEIYFEGQKENWAQLRLISEEIDGITSTRPWAESSHVVE